MYKLRLIATLYETGPMCINWVYTCSWYYIQWFSDLCCLKVIWIHLIVLCNGKFDIFLHKASWWCSEKLQKLKTGLGLYRSIFWDLNRAARIVLNARKYDHVSPLLKQLHWLPVSKRIMYKVALIVYKSIRGAWPHSTFNVCLVLFNNQDIHYAQGLTLMLW